MTREEAIRCLGVHSSTNGSGLCTDKQHYEAKQMAIKALEQEFCEDAISREFMYKLGAKCIAARNENDLLVAIAPIESLPSIAPQPKMGRWIIKDGREQGYDIAGVKTWYIQIMCDKCGFIKTAIEGRTGQYRFCPKCGQPKTKEMMKE